MAGPVKPSPRPAFPAPSAAQTPGASEKGKWLALSAALLGWMFDGAEMGLFSLIGRPALGDLLSIDLNAKIPADEARVGLWFGVVTAGFLVGAATGGVLFGWLGDRIGRVRAMTLSVLTYAVFTGLCGVAAEAWQVGLLRFIAALGMGGEWSLGVALVMEVWPNRSRAFMAGLIGAAANVGYLLVALVGLGLKDILEDLGTQLAAIGMAQSTVDWLTANQGWRVLMLLGTLPALLTFFIRIFVPESQKWEQERARGGTSHWATRDLLGVLLGAIGPAIIIYLWAVTDTGISGAAAAEQGWPQWAASLIPELEFHHSLQIRLAGTLAGLLLATSGYIYPVMRYLQRQSTQGTTAFNGTQATLYRMLLGAGISGVALLGTWGSAQWASTWADQLTGGDAAIGARYYTLIAASLGAIAGTMAAALAGDWWGRRFTYCTMCLLSIGSVILFWQLNHSYGPFFLASAFVLGFFTASFYGWLPLYLPELFRTGVRATGQGFSFNFGRILAAVGTLQTGVLMKAQDMVIVVGGRELLTGDNAESTAVMFRGGYPLACTSMSMIYLAGIVLIWFLPETKGKPLPE